MPDRALDVSVRRLALAAVFPFAGFWSKDEILDAVNLKSHAAEGSAHGLYGGLYWVGVFTAGLTAFYTFRALILTFRPRAHSA